MNLKYLLLPYILSVVNPLTQTWQICQNKVENKKFDWHDDQQVLTPWEQFLLLFCSSSSMLT